MAWATEVSDSHRRIIRMRDVEKLTFIEIGSILSCTRQTARSRYVNAKAILKRLEGPNRRHEEVALTPDQARDEYRQGRIARIGGDEYDAFRCSPWRDGWREADVFLNRQEGVTA